MLVKASRRAGTHRDAAELLEHLLRGAGNEQVSEIGVPGCTARALDDALAVARDSRDALWHMSISPSYPLSDEQWQRGEEVIRDAYRLPATLPITAVEHSKPHRLAVRGTLPSRPAHRHFIWPTTDPATGKRVNPFRHYILNERVARQLEHEFGHPLTKGAHNYAVFSWARSAMPELANAIEQAGLLEDGPAQQRTSDAERKVASAAFRDGFAPADGVLAAVVAATTSQNSGEAFVAALRREGFVLALGDRLVLVPVDGSRQPLGAARKAGMREADLRRMLGSVLEQLPRIAREANVDAWLVANIPNHRLPDWRVADLIKGGINHGDEEASELVDERHERGAQRRGAQGHDIGVRHEGASGLNSGGPPSGSRRRGRERQARPANFTATGRRRPSRPDSIGVGGDFDPFAGDRRPPLVDRRRIEQARVATALAATDVARLARIEASAHRRDLTPQDAEQLLGHRVIRQTGDNDRRSRRERWLAAQLREAYDTAWLPESVAAHLRSVELRSDGVILVLWGGTRIIDRGDQMDLVGPVDDVSVKEVVEAVRRRGWTSVELEGSLEFRNAVAEKLAQLKPPILVSIENGFEPRETIVIQQPLAVLNV